jgi:hemoglobin-like flavoprotein
MTPDQIRSVQDSFALVRPIRSEAAALFYGRLFALDPSARPLFAGADLRAQGDKLMGALGFVVAALGRPGAVPGAVADLARRHAGYGVREGHYASVGEALLWTLERGLGAAFTPELRGAWAAAYGLISGAMMDAARDAAP